MKYIHNSHSVLSKNNPKIDPVFITKKNMSTLPLVVCSLKNNTLCHSSSHQDHGNPRASAKTMMMREKEMCMIMVTQRVAMMITPCKSFTTGASVTNSGRRNSKEIMQIYLEKRTLCNNFTVPTSNTSMQKNECDTRSASTPKKQDYKQKTSLKKKRVREQLLQRKDNSCKRKTTNKIYSSKRKIKGTLGKLYISSTKNNTILTLIDTNGNTKGWSCSGSLGFKNARKSTTYAAQAAAESMVKKAKILGYTHLRLLVKGLGRGKQSCLRALSKSGLKIISLEDQTGIPYNGCRASKKRRV
jgi:small subunit ribosomal protein S11